MTEQQQQELWPFPRVVPTEQVAVSLDKLLKALEDLDMTEKQVQRQRDEDYRLDLMAKATILGVGLVHIYDTENHKGGLTVAFRKVSQFGSRKMVQCAVNTCSNKDSFSKKIGAKGALEKFFNGETIELPILESWGEEDLNWVVKHSFTSLYDALNRSW
jgi:hypothetical protein